MSVGNLPFEIQNSEFPAPSSTAIKVINVRNVADGKWGESTACLMAYGTTKPTDATAGFLSGCLFFDTDAAANAQLLINQGTLSSCSFITCG